MTRYLVLLVFECIHGGTVEMTRTVRAEDALSFVMPAHPDLALVCYQITPLPARPRFTKPGSSLRAIPPVAHWIPAVYTSKGRAWRVTRWL